MAEKKHFSQSLADRLYVAEFDDALLDLDGWANPRYKGSRLVGKKINEYTAPGGGGGITDRGFKIITDYKGDITYGLNPFVERKTTAL